MQKDAVPEELMEILLCPVCRGDVKLSDDGGIQCCACRLIYPVADGIPVMLEEEAVKG